MPVPPHATISLSAPLTPHGRCQATLRADASDKRVGQERAARLAAEDSLYQKEREIAALQVELMQAENRSPIKGPQSPGALSASAVHNTNPIYREPSSPDRGAVKVGFTLPPLVFYSEGRAMWRHVMRVVVLRCRPARSMRSGLTPYRGSSRDAKPNTPSRRRPCLFALGGGPAAFNTTLPNQTTNLRRRGRTRRNRNGTG